MYLFFVGIGGFICVVFLRLSVPPRFVRRYNVSWPRPRARSLSLSTGYLLLTHECKPHLVGVGIGVSYRLHVPIGQVLLPPCLACLRSSRPTCCFVSGSHFSSLFFSSRPLATPLFSSQKFAKKYNSAKRVKPTEE